MGWASAEGRAAVEAGLAARLASVLGPVHPPGVVVSVEGAAGIGKSHLLDRLCAGTDARVWRTRGDERLRRQGFAALEELVAGAPARVHPADHAFDRVDGWCQDEPVLLCVDDAHHLDAASWGVLRRLARAARDMPLALLVAGRAHPSSPALEAFAAMADRVGLPALDRVGVEALVRERTGAWPGRRLGAVLERAAGNPLFVVEVLRELDGRGALHRAGGRIDVTAGTVGPTALDEAVGRHLAELGDAERELLQTLAVLGPAATVDELADVLYAPADLMAATAGRVARTGMVQVDGPVVAFSHDLYREAAYGSLDEPARRSTHRRAAQVSTGAAATEHLRRAGTGTDAAVADALAEAARQEAPYAPGVSAELLADAEPFLAPDDERRERLLLDRAVALYLSGQGRAAADLAAQRLRGVRDRQIAGGLVNVRIRALVNRADTAESLATIDATLATPGLPPPVATALAQLRAWVLLMDGRLGSATEEAQRWRGVEGDGTTSAAYLTLAYAAFLHGRPDDALALLGDVERALPPGDPLGGRLTVLVWPALFELAARGPAAARVVLARMRQLAAERGAGWILPLHAFVAGGIAMAAAEWDVAMAEFDSGLELAREQDLRWVSTAVGRRAYLDAHRGRGAAARRRLAEFRASGLPLHFGLDHPGLADLAVLEAAGDLRAAVTLARELWSATPGRGEEWMLTVAPDVARAALAGVERDLLRRVAAGTAELRGLQDRTAAPTALRCGGMAAGDRDQVEEAAESFAAAGWTVVAAHAREECASLAAAFGDRTAAVAAMERALLTYDDAGATVDRDRLLARLRILGVRRGPRSRRRTAASGWAALTPTERRVAALVREGRTNPEIAAALFVSPRTVQTHVSHILAKLGLRSRIEVAGLPELRTSADVSATGGP